MAESDDESDDDHAEQNGSGHQAFPLHHFTFILFIMAVAVVVRFMLATISSRHYHPPFTVVMGIAGFAAGMIQELAGGKQGLWGDSVEAWYRVGPEFILFVLLPPLLFESAFGMKFHVFAKQAKAAIVLAGPGVLLSTALTGSFAVLLYGQTDKDFDWPAAMLLGSILSATDPVAVVAVLHTYVTAPLYATLSPIPPTESHMNKPGHCRHYHYCRRRRRRRHYHHHHHHHYLISSHLNLASTD